MTGFEKYCKDRGYDPKGEFMMVPSVVCSLQGRFKDLTTKTKVIVKLDQGTYIVLCSFFINGAERLKWMQFDDLIQEKKDSMIDFDYKKVLPVCWVRDRHDSEWYKRWYVTNSAGVSYTIITDCMTFESWKYITFEDPDEKVRDDLRKQISDYECRIAELKKKLGKMQ